MRRFSLSNLHLRSNLLSLDYQQELDRITVFEVKDTWRRCPLIKDPGRLTRSLVALTLKAREVRVAPGGPGAP